MRLSPSNGPVGTPPACSYRNTKRTIGTLMFAGSTLLLSAPFAHAASSYVGTWNGLYPNSTTADNADCQTCHAASTQNLNPYGEAICSSSAGNITDRILDAENADSDGDPTGSNNITEIDASTQPGWTTTAVATYARGNCLPTGNTENAPAGIGELDPTLVGNAPPIANDDTYSTPFQTQLTIITPGVLGNDTDADGDPLSVVLPPDTGTSNGTLSLNADGSFTYDPNTGFSGTDSFTYVANDGTDNSTTAATVTITVGQLPTNDTDADGIIDFQDNCIEEPNADQRNTDGDGYGNMCDPDFDNSGTVDTGDFSLLKSMLGSSNAPDQDLNGNSMVDPTDFSITKAYAGLPPGPSCVDLTGGCAP